MKMRWQSCVAGCVLAGWVAAAAEPVTVKVVKPKPIGPEVEKGVAWLVAHQLPGGGWGQGEEAANMGRGEGLRDVPNVADTCVSVLALLRAGHTPQEGSHAEAVRRGVAFVCEQVMNSDADSLYVTEIRGTRVQGKIGTYVDTFLAAQLLTEIKDLQPGVTNALAKIIHKIEKNQTGDGGWAGGGWAPVHSEALATKAINRAAAAGVQVSESVRGKAQGKAGSKYDAAKGRFASEGSAGVDLYAASAALNGLQESKNFNDGVRQQLEQQAANAPTAQAREDAQARIRDGQANERALEASRKAMAEKLDDPSFIAGFGNNGGEEFLSYMNIGESLVVEGGEPWTKWDEKIGANLRRVQNGDGSWTGHHCITGRNFCTATALLVLMTDRMTLPSAQGLAKR